jgi:deoxyribose-phosphate aldolase
MYIEYYINSIDEKEEDIKQNISKVLTYPVSSVLANHSIARLIKKNFLHTKIGCFIDYPIAASDFDSRQQQIIDAINIGANYVAITIPFFQIVNRKYAKFRDDIRKNLDICQKYQIDIRYILEYRKFDHQLLAKVCEILMENTINIVYPSSGLFIDNIQDNIIASAYLHEKTGIQTIVNANIWKQSHVDSILKINPYGISLNQISNFELIDKTLYD